MSLRDQLRAGSQALGLSLTQPQLEQLLDYLYLLEKWNRVYNLTAIRQLPNMLTHHLLDSLSLRPRFGQCIKALDVGSGAGLPGIPLAIAMPNSSWTLLDSNSRRTRFIQQAVAQCELDNVQVVHTRVQDYHAPDSLDFIVSRAYAPLAEFCASVVHLLGPDTRLMTMKTGLRRAELQQLDRSYFEFEEEIIKVPGINETRSLVTVTVL